MNRTSSCLTLATLLVICTTAPALAQLDTGTIVGTVRDQSSAVVPGATVTATQESTGTAVTTVTTDKGQFVFPTLKVGSYSIAAELSGFRKSVQTGIALHVQERIEVDVRLDLGSVSEEVVVSGRTELLQTQTADVGYSVDRRQVTDLPLLGRRYSELAFLTTGVVAAPAGLTGRGEDGMFNVNGNLATWNNFILDGGDNNSASTNLQERSTEVVQPPVDALEEFRVQTRTYSAEFGKAAGAVINASIKQGSNALKGNLFEFFRDDAFNANTWENNRAGRPKGSFEQHIAGGTLGGPIVRSRTFFFGDYQATRTDKALTQLATVPTDLMRQGNLTEFTGTMIAGNPFVAAGCVNAAARTISASCIDPVAASLLKLYPRANVPQALAAFGVPGGFVSPNYISNGILKNDVDQFDIRVDQNLAAAKSQVFARYSFMDVTRHEPPVLDDPIASGDFSSDTYNRGQSAVGGWSKVFGGAVFSEFRGAWNRMSSSSLQPSFGVAANAQYGIRGVPDDPRYSGGLPHMNISRLTRLGGPFFRPQYQTSQVFQFSENVTWNRSAHTYKFGVERRRDKVDYIDLRALNGVLNFTDGRYTGFGFGDFLMGLSSQQGLTLFREADLYSDGWQFYGQDSWRLGSNVTVNYGLRYEYFTPMQDKANLMTNIDPATGAIVTSTSAGDIYARTLIHPDRNNFAPRLGVAWNPSSNVVVRAGYGIFYQEYDRYGSESQLALNPPQLVDVSLIANSGTDAPPMILRNGFAPVSPANIDKTRVQWRIQDPNQKTPWVQQFSLGPEYQIGSSTVVGLEYVGNLTRNGRKLRNLNQGIVVAPGSVVFPYAQYGFANAYLEQIATDGQANYHSVQARVQRRLSGGLAFTSSFTYGRALGNFLDHLSADGGGESGNFPKNVYDLAADYGPLSIDIRKRFVTSFIYELPVGSGRKRQLSGIAGALASDWNVNGILSISDGRPFSITSTDRVGTGPGRISRANCTGDPLPGGFDQTIDHWFDTTAFAEPTAFTYGTCSPNSVVGPGSKSMNLSLFRSIPFNGRRLELRVESFNTFNWVNWGRPGQSVSNAATFGRISSTQGDPRELQFAVKMYF
ncbi:MAG: hypothetical protein DMG00_23485 [Acidobacteria bacterium]|nr:MAG: hypothetical protein DMG00_23485 [Acidobacteriota bacterium]